MYCNLNGCHFSLRFNIYSGQALKFVKDNGDMYGIQYFLGKAL